MNKSYKYRRGLKGGPNEINVQGSISVDGYKSGSKDVNNDFNIIKSNNITMKGVDFPVHGIDNLGYSQTMMPGFDYTFPGSEVFEVPLKGYQLGGDILKFLKEKMRDEIAPIGYDNAINRIIDVLNPFNQNKETSLEKQKAKYDKYSTTHGDDNFNPHLFQGGIDVLNERQDLFSILLGLDQKHNTIPVSKYKPTKTKNNDDIDYYSSPLTEKQITDFLAGTDITKQFGNVDKFKKYLNDPGWSPINYGEVTGNFHIDHGEDERGPYVSYYDIWDLDPFGVGDWTDQNALLKAITDFGQNKILGVQPAELYNRLYYTLDDEGKIRFDDYPDAMSAYDRYQLEKKKQKEKKQKGGESIIHNLHRIRKQGGPISNRSLLGPYIPYPEKLQEFFQEIPSGLGNRLVNWKETLADNLHPGYYSRGKNNPAHKRIFNAVVNDDKEYQVNFFNILNEDYSKYKETGEMSERLYNLFEEMGYWKEPYKETEEYKNNIAEFNDIQRKLLGYPKYKYGDNEEKQKRTADDLKYIKEELHEAYLNDPYTYNIHDLTEEGRKLYDEAYEKLIADNNKKAYESRYLDEEGIDWMLWKHNQKKDLFRLSIGLPQEHNTIPLSEYKPTKSENPDAQYYTSPSTDTDIKSFFEEYFKFKQKNTSDNSDSENNLKLENPEIKKGNTTYSKPEDEIKGFVTYLQENIGGRNDKLKGTNRVHLGQDLGEFILDAGEDEKGHYISYYDLWDVNPFGSTAVKNYNSKDYNISENITNKLQELTGTEGIEIYNRIYYDPKTGEILSEVKERPEAYYGLKKYGGYLDKAQSGATVPTEQVAQDDPRYNRDMDDDGVPVGIDIDDSREVPNQLMLLQAMKESSLDPKKISKKGAKGLTQVMPATLQDYIKNTGDKDVDLYDWKDSMKIQKWYMNNLYNRPWINKQNQNQNVRLAKTLAAYNWGPTKFNKFLNKVKDGVDIYDHKMEWLDHPDLPIETRDYIKTVLLRENEEFEGWVQEHNKNESKQAYIEAYGGIYKKGGSLLFPEWKRIRKHWKNYLSGKSINRDMYNKMVAYGFIKKKKYKRPDKRNRSFKNISSKNILKALNLGKMKKGGSLPEQVKIYEDYVRGVFDGTDLEEKAKRTVDKIDRFYYYDLKGKDTHTLDHIKKLQKGGDMQFDKMNQTARLQEAGYDTTYEDFSGKRTPVTTEQALEAGEIAGGFVPYLGEAIDAKNTIKSAVEGRYGDMVMNAAGLMIPFIPGKVLVKGKNAIKGLFKKGSKEAAEKVAKEIPEWSKGIPRYPANEKAHRDALQGLIDQGKYLDEMGFDAKTLRGENMVFHGQHSGRSIVEVALPDGRTQLFYKSTGGGGKAVDDMWQPFGGFDEKGWFIKDGKQGYNIGNYEDFYNSKSYRDISGSLDKHMVDQNWDMSGQVLYKKGPDGKLLYDEAGNPIKTYPYRK